MLKRLINLGEERKLLEGKFDYKAQLEMFEHCSNLLAIDDPLKKISPLLRSIGAREEDRVKRWLREKNHLLIEEGLKQGSAKRKAKCEKLKHKKSG